MRSMRDAISLRLVSLLSIDGCARKSLEISSKTFLERRRERPSLCFEMGLEQELFRSKRRYPRGGCCILDGNRKPNADKKTLVSRVQNTGDDANHLAIQGHQRAAGVSRINCGIELDEVC